MKYFNAEFWKLSGISVSGVSSSFYAFVSSEAASRPLNGYDIAIARAIALVSLACLIAKFFLLVRKKKEED